LTVPMEWGKEKERRSGEFQQRSERAEKRKKWKGRDGYRLAFNLAYGRRKREGEGEENSFVFKRQGRKKGKRNGLEALQGWGGGEGKRLG